MKEIQIVFEVNISSSNKGLRTEKVWDRHGSDTVQSRRLTEHPLKQRVTKRVLILDGHNLLLITNLLILIVHYVKDARW